MAVDYNNPNDMPIVDYDINKVPPEIREMTNGVEKAIYGWQNKAFIKQGMDIAGIYAGEAKIIAEQTQYRQDAVETFNNQVVREMTDKDVISSPEIIQARGSYGTLKERLEAMQHEITSGSFVILSQSEYDALSTKDPDIVYLIKGSPVTYREETRTESVPFATERVANSAMAIGTETTVTQGQNGTRTIIERVSITDGIETGRTIISNTITKAPVNKVVHYGTKGATNPTEPTTLSNLLRSSDLFAGGSSNTYVNNQRTTNDVVPATGTFEIRQWAEPAGAFNIYAEKVEPFKDYTIAMTIENLSSITDAWLVIGTAFFGGTHYFNGVMKNITPEAGSYNILAHVPTSGAVNYVYQFTGLEDASPTDFFQFAITNADNNAKFKISNLGLYEGHTTLDAPFSGNIDSPGETGTTDVPIGGNLTIVASPITLYWDSDKAIARDTTQSGVWTNKGTHEVLNKRTQGGVTFYGLTIGWVRSDDNV